MELVKAILTGLLNLIYNKKCVICGCSKTDDLLCKNCLKDVHYLSNFAHRVYCSIPIYCAFNYQGIIKKLIQLLKFSHKKKCAKVLAQLLFSYFKRLKLSYSYVLVYPPSMFLKTASRGYNPMELIALEFSKLTGLRVEKDLIKKVKYTLPQYKAKNRKKNIKGSFKINPILNKDKNILLLDDITTSGATLEEIINLLKDEGYENITCLVLSKAVR